MALILVTGATGRHGGTGAHVARRLREQGHRVRVLARTRGARTEALEAAGVEVRVGDLRDRASLLPAMEGVEQATFCFPVDAGIVEAAASFSSALRQAAPSARVVVMSMLAAQETSPSHLGRAQWLAEEVMAWSGLELCVLRIAAMFHENIALLHATSLRESGVLRTCFGDARVPWIAGQDAAELMVAALLHPGRFGGETIVYPPGAEWLTHADIAAILASELARPVRHEPVPVEAWRDELLGLADRGDSAINRDMARHISALGLALSQRSSRAAPDASALVHLLGRAPLSFRDFARDHRETFLG